MRNKTRKFKRLLAGPYLFWSVSFIIIPLLMIFYYGLTDKDGAFTLLNIAKITFTSGVNAASEEYTPNQKIDRCPLCGIALNENGVCPKCGYRKN